MTPVKPMLASAAGDILRGPGTVMETKLDGWRALFDSGDDDEAGTFSSRSGKAINVPYLAAALANLPSNTIIDGEIVDLHAGVGREWNRTQSLLSRTKPHVPTADDPPLTYVIFDVLQVYGKPAMQEPLSARKQLLGLVARLAGENVRQVTEWSGEQKNLDEVYERIVDEGYEGVVCKHLNSLYVPGARDGQWVKVKPEKEIDCEVTGTYAPEAGSKYEGKAVGGITFRTPEGYDGRAAGMNDELRTALHVTPEQYVGKVAVIAYASAGENGALRFPRFKRFRDEADKPVTEVKAANERGNSLLLLERALSAEAEVTRLTDENTKLRERVAVLFDEPMHVEAPPIPKPSATVQPPQPPTPGAVRSTARRKMRNYKAMGAVKLRESAVSLKEERGEAYLKARSDEVAGLFTVAAHRAACRRACEEKQVPSP